MSFLAPWLCCGIVRAIWFVLDVRQGNYYALLENEEVANPSPFWAYCLVYPFLYLILGPVALLVRMFA